MTDRTDLTQDPVEVAPTAPVAASARNRMLSRVAIAGGSLLLGGAAIAAALAGPAALAQSDGSVMTLANSVTGSLADLSAGSGFGPGGWGHDGGRMGHGDGMGLGRSDAGDEMAAAAEALGLSATDLQAKLQAGSSLAEIATAQGVDVQTVIDALVKVETAEIDAALKAGTITQAQADQFTAMVVQRETDFVNRTPGADCDRDGSAGTGMRGGHGMALLGPNQADELAAAAKALGVSTADLTTELQAGSTLADVAKAQSVDVQTVIDALVTAEKAEIDAAVKAGTITQAQADQMATNLTQRVTDLVNGTFRGGMGGRGHHGGMRGGERGGFGPGQFGPGQFGAGPDASGGSAPVAPSSTSTAPSA